MQAIITDGQNQPSLAVLLINVQAPEATQFVEAGRLAEVTEPARQLLAGKKIECVCGNADQAEADNLNFFEPPIAPDVIVGVVVKAQAAADKSCVDQMSARAGNCFGQLLRTGEV